MANETEHIERDANEARALIGRARGQRPCRRSAAEERDEIAAIYLIELHSMRISLPVR
jgi:hypothetical protein